MYISDWVLHQFTCAVSLKPWQSIVLDKGYVSSILLDVFIKIIFFLQKKYENSSSDQTFIQQPLAHHNIDITTNIVDEAEEH